MIAASNSLNHARARGEFLASIHWKIRLRFRLALAVSSTRYVIFGANLVEHLTRRTGAAFGGIFKALADAFGRAGFGRQIEEPLIGLGILHHGGGFSIHRQHKGTFCLSEVTQKFRRMIAEGGHGLNVFGDVHRAALLHLLPNSVMPFAAKCKNERWLGFPGMLMGSPWQLR